MFSLNLPRSLSHHNVADLPISHGSKAILARSAATSAILFVHGFRGDALQTWEGFDDLAPQNSVFQAADLFFFGYDGFKSNTLAAASFLYELLNSLATNPLLSLGTLLSPRDQQARRAGYSRIIVVAHSLGAVVSRWALTRAAEQGADWRNKIKLILFAPAHCGSDLQRIAAAATAGFPWLRALTDGISLAVPLVSELTPGSPILKELEARTAKLLGNGEAALKASRVIIAEREIVVSNLPFIGDPHPNALPDTDHINVCKPTQSNLEPIRFVAELLL